MWPFNKVRNRIEEGNLLLIMLVIVDNLRVVIVVALALQVGVIH